MAWAAVKAAALVLGLNYGVHYASARLYDIYCVPHSLNEVVQSIVTTASPVCSFLLNTMTVTQNNYATAVTVTVASALTSALKSGGA